MSTGTPLFTDDWSALYAGKFANKEVCQERLALDWFVLNGAKNVKTPNDPNNSIIPVEYVVCLIFWSERHLTFCL
jgi:hypothetical protein